MAALSSYDVFNLNLQRTIATGDPQAVADRLRSPDAQDLVRLAQDQRFHPAVMLRLTLHQLRAVAQVGPWSLTDLPDLIGESVGTDGARDTGGQGQTPLMAVIGGFDDLTPEDVRAGMARALLPLLLPHQDPLAVDDQGLTALGRAIRFHHAAAFELLLPLTDVAAANAQGRMGNTLLLNAVQFGTLAMVQQLLPHHDPATQDLDGNGVLHQALMREDKLGEREAIMALLLPRVPRWTTNSQDHTPLQMAVRRRDLASVTQLMDGYVPPRAGPVQQGLRFAYNQAVSASCWDLVQAIVNVLPEDLGRTWLNTSMDQHLLRREMTPVLDVAERIWEARALRHLADEVAPTLSPKGRSRL